MTNRSLRRHHTERITKKMDREDYYTLSASLGKKIGSGLYTERDRQKAHKKLHNHRKACSCWMCGNPRRQKLGRKDRLTIQELKADERADSF